MAHSSSFTHYSGDAASYILKPDQQKDGVPYEWIADNDGDGLLDELEAEVGSDLYNEDTDGDGLSDYHEYFVYGTSLLLTDSDGDGQSDYDEITAGTSPNDASQRFEASISANPENKHLILRWKSVEGKSYIIQTAQSVEGPWSNYSPFSISGNGEILSIQFDISSESKGTSFYRISIE